MKKLLFKSKAVSSAALLLICAALFSACGEKFHDDSKVTASVSTTAKTEPTLPPIIITEPSLSTEVSVATEVSFTTEVSVTTEATVTTEPVPQTQNISDFLGYDTESPQYKLAYLLTNCVPNVVHETEVTVAVTETTAAVTEATAAVTEATAAVTEATVTAEVAPVISSETMTESSAEPATDETADTDETGELSEYALLAEAPKTEIIRTVYDGEVSLYCIDLTDNSAMGFNCDKKMYPASMVKAVYIYTLLRAADKGEIDLSEEMVYTKSMLRTGSGDFASVEDGTAFTVRALIELAARKSDNTAYAMLTDRFGYEYFTEIAAEDGLDTVYRNYNKATAVKYAEFFAKLSEYFDTESENAVFLRKAMCNSQQTVMLRNGFRPVEVAHKYGWDEFSYCDGGVVLGEHRLAVVFLSNLDEGHLKRANTDFIYKMCEYIGEIYAEKYAGAVADQLFKEKDGL